MNGQVWYLTLEDGVRRMFYRSMSLLLSDVTMWEVLRNMEEDGKCPLLVENPLPHWETKEMRGKTYYLVPIAEIKLIDYDKPMDNNRIFLSDHIRGSTSEQ